jgi:hypothetical protein
MWARQGIEDGHLSVAELRGGPPSARALAREVKQLKEDVE